MALSRTFTNGEFLPMAETAYRINLSSVRALQDVLKPVSLAEAPDDLFQQIMKANQTMLEMDYTSFPDTSGNPTYAKYASIVVNGKVVAQIDNHGWLETSNAMAGACTQAINKADASAGVTSGPLLAQTRAEKLAESLHGQIVKASSAMTQSAFESVPQPKATVDTKAMINDPRYAQLEQLQQAHAAFLAQQIAQNQAAG